MSARDLPVAYSAGLRRLDRDTARAVGVVRSEAVAALTLVHAIAAVTQEAVNAAARLKAQEAQLIKLSPLGESQYQYLVDCGIAAMGAVLQRQGRLL